MREDVLNQLCSFCNPVGCPYHPQTHIVLKAIILGQGRHWAHDAPTTQWPVWLRLGPAAKAEGPLGNHLCATEGLAFGRATAEEHAAGRAVCCYQKTPQKPWAANLYQRQCEEGRKAGFHTKVPSELVGLLPVRDFHHLSHTQGN